MIGTILLHLPDGLGEGLKNGYWAEIRNLPNDKRIDNSVWKFVDIIKNLEGDYRILVCNKFFPAPEDIAGVDGIISLRGIKSPQLKLQTITSKNGYLNYSNEPWPEDGPPIWHFLIYLGKIYVGELNDADELVAALSDTAFVDTKQQFTEALGKRTKMPTTSLNDSVDPVQMEREVDNLVELKNELVSMSYNHKTRSPYGKNEIRSLQLEKYFELAQQLSAFNIKYPIALTPELREKLKPVTRAMYHQRVKLITKFDLRTQKLPRLRRVNRPDTDIQEATRKTERPTAVPNSSANIAQIKKSKHWAKRKQEYSDLKKQMNTPDLSADIAQQSQTSAQTLSAATAVCTAIQAPETLHQFDRFRQASAIAMRPPTEQPMHQATASSAPKKSRPNILRKDLTQHEIR